MTYSRERECIKTILTQDDSIGVFLQQDKMKGLISGVQMAT